MKEERYKPLWAEQNDFLEHMADVFDVASPEQTEIDMPDEFDAFGQLFKNGVLDQVAVDKAGRLWRQDLPNRKITMFFDPRVKPGEEAK